MPAGHLTPAMVTPPQAPSPTGGASHADLVAAAGAAHLLTEPGPVLDRITGHVIQSPCVLPDRPVMGFRLR